MVFRETDSSGGTVTITPVSATYVAPTPTGGTTTTTYKTGGEILSQPTIVYTPPPTVTTPPSTTNIITQPSPISFKQLVGIPLTPVETFIAKSIPTVSITDSVPLYVKETVAPSIPKSSSIDLITFKETFGVPLTTVEQLAYDVQKTQTQIPVTMMGSPVFPKISPPQNIIEAGIGGTGGYIPISAKEQMMIESAQHKATSDYLPGEIISMNVAPTEYKEKYGYVPPTAQYLFNTEMGKVDTQIQDIQKYITQVKEFQTGFKSYETIVNTSIADIQGSPDTSQWWFDFNQDKIQDANELLSKQDALAYYQKEYDTNLATYQMITGEKPSEGDVLSITDANKLLVDLKNQKYLLGQYKEAGYNLEFTDTGYLFTVPKASEVVKSLYAGQDLPLLYTAQEMRSFGVGVIGAGIQDLITGGTASKEAEFESASRSILGTRQQIGETQMEYIGRSLTSPEIIMDIYVPLATFGVSKAIMLGGKAIAPTVRAWSETSKIGSSITKFGGGIGRGIALYQTQHPYLSYLGGKTFKYGMFGAMEGGQLYEVATTRPEEFGATLGRGLWHWEMAWESMNVGLSKEPVVFKKPQLKLTEFEMNAPGYVPEGVVRQQMKSEIDIYQTPMSDILPEAKQYTGFETLPGAKAKISVEGQPTITVSVDAHGVTRGMSDLIPSDLAVNPTMSIGKAKFSWTERVWFTDVEHVSFRPISSSGKQIATFGETGKLIESVDVTGGKVEEFVGQNITSVEKSGEIGLYNIERYAGSGEYSNIIENVIGTSKSKGIIITKQTEKEAEAILGKTGTGGLLETERIAGKTYIYPDVTPEMLKEFEKQQFLTGIKKDYGTISAREKYLGGGAGAELLGGKGDLISIAKTETPVTQTDLLSLQNRISAYNISEELTKEAGLVLLEQPLTVPISLTKPIAKTGIMSTGANLLIGQQGATGISLTRQTSKLRSLNLISTGATRLEQEAELISGGIQENVLEQNYGQRNLLIGRSDLITGSQRRHGIRDLYAEGQTEFERESVASGTGLISQIDMEGLTQGERVQFQQGLLGGQVYYPGVELGSLEEEEGVVPTTEYYPGIEITEFEQGKETGTFTDVDIIPITTGGIIATGGGGGFGGGGFIPTPIIPIPKNLYPAEQGALLSGGYGGYPVTRKRRKRPKGLPPDLLSVTLSQARHGSATAPKETRSLFRESAKHLFIRTPTVELMKGKPKYTLERSRTDLINANPMLNLQLNNKINIENKNGLIRGNNMRNLIGNKKKKGGKKNAYY